MPDPEFEYTGTAVVVTLRKSAEDVQIQGTRVETRGKTRVETRGKTRVETRGKAKEKILEAIKQNSQITIPELCSIIGLTQKGIEWNIRKLKAEGLLRRVGPTKGGRWEVLTKRSTSKNQ